MDIGSKLSKHTLSMKFMRKTKDQIDRFTEEKKHRQHFNSESAEDILKASNQSLVEEVPSYSQILGYTYARVSFGGFNKDVEYNVSRRIWKPEWAQDEEGEVEDEEQKEKDVTDEQMAKNYGSIIATVGKKFINKRTRDVPDSDDDEEDSPPRRSNGRGRTSQNNQRDSNRKRGHLNETDSRNYSPPPSKRSKFIKPDDNV